MLVCSRACVCVCVCERCERELNYFFIMTAEENELLMQIRTCVMVFSSLLLCFSFIDVCHTHVCTCCAIVCREYLIFLLSFFFIFLHLRVIEMCVFASAILALTMRVPESFYASNVFFLYFRYQQKLSSGKNLSEECITVTIFLSQN